MADASQIDDIKNELLKAFQDDSPISPLDKCIRELIRIEKRALYDSQSRGKMKSIEDAVNRHFLDSLKDEEKQ